MLELALHRFYFFGGETSGKNHLQHFDIIAVPKLAMAYVRRLMYTRAGFKSHHALTFIFELDPALQDINKLEGCLVEVRLT